MPGPWRSSTAALCAIGYRLAAVVPLRGTSATSWYECHFVVRVPLRGTADILSTRSFLGDYALTLRKGERGEDSAPRVAGLRARRWRSLRIIRPKGEERLERPECPLRGYRRNEGRSPTAPGRAATCACGKMQARVAVR
jgi:hypothetical protein